MRPGRALAYRSTPHQPPWLRPLLLLILASPAYIDGLILHARSYRKHLEKR
jgi:hypothetical protein